MQSQPKGLQKRKQLFDRFSGQLSLLKEKGLFGGDLEFEKTYICPICLRQFPESALLESPSQNFLTLEDAPPDSLGGSKIAMTCKECNNDCGRTIDFHLTEVLREIDASYFYKGSSRRGTIDFEGQRLQVELTSLGNGTLQAYHRTKLNNPTLLDRFIYGIKNKTVSPFIHFNPPKSRVDPKRVNYALLKSNYIITFAKFGYIFLLDPAYNSLRQQLLKPDTHTFPWAPFIKDQFTSTQTGTYYMHNNGLKSIFNVFALKTEYSETLIGGLIPQPSLSFEELGKRVDAGKDHDDTIIFDTTIYDPAANLFSDYNEIRKVYNWSYKS